jgi:hypothetical protein
MSILIFYLFTNKTIDFKVTKNFEKLKLIDDEKFIYHSEYYKILKNVYTSNKDNRINCKDFLNFWIDILIKLDKNYIKNNNDNNDKNDNEDYFIKNNDNEENDDEIQYFNNENENEKFDLKIFLKSINLEKYEKNFIDNGFDDINNLIEIGNIFDEDFIKMNITVLDDINLIRKALNQIKNNINNE